MTKLKRICLSCLHKVKMSLWNTHYIKLLEKEYLEALGLLQMTIDIYVMQPSDETTAKYSDKWWTKKKRHWLDKVTNAWNWIPSINEGFTHVMWSMIKEQDWSSNCGENLLIKHKITLLRKSWGWRKKNSSLAISHLNTYECCGAVAVLRQKPWTGSDYPRWPYTHLVFEYSVQEHGNQITETAYWAIAVEGKQQQN